jgi:hypothetical protein
MSLNELPNEIINNILIEYTSIFSNKGINKYIENQRNKKIKKSLNIINKIISRYMITRRYAIDYYEDSYYIPKIYWKKYYPLSERKYFLYLVMKQNLNRYDEINNIYNDFLKNTSKNITITFNKIIDLLNNEELFSIGW